MSGTSNYNGVQYLTPTDFQTSTAKFVEPTAWNVNPDPRVSGNGFGRAVPDLSADADPYSGYLLYEPSFAAPASRCSRAAGAARASWHPSSTARRRSSTPTWGTGSGCGTRPVRVRRGPSPFTPLNQAGTSNDNLFYTGNPGELYNPATGLGVPNLTELAGDLR